MEFRSRRKGVFSATKGFFQNMMFYKLIAGNLAFDLNMHGLSIDWPFDLI